MCACHNRVLVALDRSLVDQRHQACTFCFFSHVQLVETVVEEEVAALVDNDKVGFLPVTTLSARCASLSSTGPRRQSLWSAGTKKKVMLLTMLRASAVS